MINEVRNTVLAIINKNNYGYISPADFNLYAEQAQLDIFEDYFYNYNSQVNKENSRQSGTGLADIKKGLEEVLDSFSVFGPLTKASSNTYNLPSDYYLVQDLIYGKKIIERVSNNKIRLLLNSNLTSPTKGFPAYTLSGATSAELGNTVTIYPPTINGVNDVSVQYIRYPLPPKWTFQSLSGGEPIFDQGQSDYQDFELPLSDSINIVQKILQYAGLSIREGDVYTYAQNEQVEQQNEEN
jgi:hypothetical protein